MNKKILLLILLIFGCFFISASSVDALKMGRVTNQNGVNIRYGPGSNYNTAGSLSYNDIVPLISSTLEKATSSCPSGWYKVNYNGYVRYLCSTYVSTSNNTVKIKTSNKISVRNGPGSNYSRHTYFYNNKIATLASTTKYKGKGCSSGWYKINYNTSSSKYICSYYTEAYNSNSNVIVSNKNGASIKSSVSNTTSLATLKYNQALTLYSTSKKTNASCSGGYYMIFYKNYIRYVCSNDVYNTSINGSVNNSLGVNVRSGADSSSSKIITLSYNDGVIITSSDKYSGSGCSSGWYKININGKDGYVCSAYVTTSSVTTNITDTSSLSFREGAGTEFKNLTDRISENTKIYLLSTTKYVGNGCVDGWYKINYNGKTGYVCSTYTVLGKNTTLYKTLSKVNASSSSYYYTSNLWTHRINEDYGYTRTGAGTSYSTKNLLYLGTDTRVLASYGSTSGCSSGWYKVAYYNNKIGYICKNLVDSYSSVTKSDSTYCDTLKAKGFPASYCKYLSKLHSLHPNWIFVPEKTGVTFNNAVLGESEKNYTLHTQGAYLASNVTQERGGWKTASDSYVAFMLDPRNYFNEKNLFVFEDLGYNSTYQTKDAVRSIVNGTYLDTDTYAGYFIDAGKTYDVSPVHLASRVKQEGGTNSSYAAVSGTVTTKWSISGYVCSTYVKTTTGSLNASVNYSSGINLRSSAKNTVSNVITVLPNNQTLTLSSTTKYTGAGCDGGWYKIKAAGLKGIYNYYNIGAYGSNPVLRGLAAAAGYVDDNYGTPWNSRNKAIKYGAKFIGKGYINKGQDTMYYQKFNTGPDNYFNKYTHQYMTNILAPASESLSTYNSYKNLGLINTKFVFKIPVYSNTPSTHTSHPPVGSYNSYLKNIFVDGKAITSFNKYVTSYNFYVSNSKTTAKVTASLSSSYASVVGTGTKTISSTTTKVTLRVTSQVGTSRIYTIYIIKTPNASSLTAKEIVDKTNVKTNGSYMSGFVEGTSANKLANLFYKVAPNCDVSITNASGTTRTIRVRTGDKITIKNGDSTKTYTLVLKGDIYKDGYVNNNDLTKLNEYLSGDLTLSGVEKQASDTNYDGVINNTDYLRIQKHINNEIVLK